MYIVSMNRITVQCGDADSAITVAHGLAMLAGYGSRVTIMRRARNSWDWLPFYETI